MECSTRVVAAVETPELSSVVGNANQTAIKMWLIAILGIELSKPVGQAQLQTQIIGHNLLLVHKATLHRDNVGKMRLPWVKIWKMSWETRSKMI